MDSNYSLNFKEITRMPSSFLQDLNQKCIDGWRVLGRKYEIEGVADKVCIRYGNNYDICVYDLSENSWSWLPQCPLKDDDNREPYWRKLLPYPFIFSFEARPDMKVE
jgi:hypothetical protein